MAHTDAMRYRWIVLTAASMVLAMTVPVQAAPVTGTSRDDRLVGTSKDDVIRAFEGDDDIFGRGGRDRIIAGPGRDEVRAGAGNDYIRVADAGTAASPRAANMARDIVRCGAGWDRVVADIGIDSIATDCEDVVPAGSGPLTIVSLGDSVASGEGIYYGFTWQTVWGIPQWVGPKNPNPTWDPPYPLCHDSQPAYPNVLAENLQATLYKFACTGATYDNGITGPRVVKGVQYRPAEFTGNPDYPDDADVVVITLGADDVQFVNIVVNCMARLLIDDEQCTAANPGQTVQTDFWDELPTLQANLETLIADVYAAGGADPPLIILTTYYDPFPAPDSGLSCIDTEPFTADQIAYYTQTMIPTLDQTIRDAVAASGGKAVVADLSQSMAAHTWCSLQPWIYGPSLQLLSWQRQPGPFHPTPAGQRQIASIVEDVIQANLP